ncbi:molybdate ABC transporter substrate-binding protein [Sulfurimonas sp.]|uniref:molybdate ABC transporter substrate-binding protein n=1 Tax=Sulfurimonas sp. TaxID=2022749 RepID=UPI003568EC7A
MLKLLLGSLLLGTLLQAGSINIAVAANVSYAMEDLKYEFNKLYPNTNIKVTLGSSGKLTAQIKNGAPYELFMAANMKYPEALYKDSIAVTKPVIYAQGSLAYLSSKKLDFSKGIKIVEDSKISKIAIANPKTAPYGKAAIEALKNGGIYEKVSKKFIYAESISQTVAYAVTAADLGFIAKSSLYSPKMKKYKKGVNWEAVDIKLYTPINQGIVILKNAQNNKEVKAFYDFMLSKKAKDILESYGYLIP